MRDPLAWIPVRYKLPLTFGFLCLVAFGLGGYLVVNTARESLSEQIRFRLNEQAATLNLVVDRSLDLLGHRVEDFASDGFIRMKLEQLTLARHPADEHQVEAVRDELVRHLRANKLALVDEFVDAFLLDVSGRPVVTAHSSGGSTSTSFDRESLWVGPLTDRSEEFPFPTYVLSTPVDSLKGELPIGYLQIVVRADVWARGLEEALEFPGATGFTARILRPLFRCLRAMPTRSDSRARLPDPDGGWTWPLTEEFFPSRSMTCSGSSSIWAWRWSP